MLETLTVTLLLNVVRALARWLKSRQNYNANDPNLIKRVGDTIDYNNDAYIA